MTPSALKRDFRGEQIDYSDTNREVNQKLSALSKALTDATALLKSAGLPAGTQTLDEDVCMVLDYV